MEKDYLRVYGRKQESLMTQKKIFVGECELNASNATVKGGYVVLDGEPFGRTGRLCGGLAVG